MQMTLLERTFEEHRIRVEKLITVYGLDRSLGQGGFSTPFSRRGDPSGLPRPFFGQSGWIIMKKEA